MLLYSHCYVLPSLPFCEGTVPPLRRAFLFSFISRGDCTSIAACFPIHLLVVLPYPHCSVFSYSLSSHEATVPPSLRVFLFISSWCYCTPIAACVFLFFILWRGDEISPINRGLQNVTKEMNFVQKGGKDESGKTTTRRHGGK